MVRCYQLPTQDRKRESRCITPLIVHLGPVLVPARAIPVERVVVVFEVVASAYLGIAPEPGVLAVTTTGAMLVYSSVQWTVTDGGTYQLFRFSYWFNPFL